MWPPRMLTLVLPNEVLEKRLILGALRVSALLVLALLVLALHVTLSVLISWLQAVLVLDEEEQAQEVERRLEDHLPVAVVHPDLEISILGFKLECFPLASFGSIGPGTSDQSFRK